jgi:hypothetical protein
MLDYTPKPIKYNNQINIRGFQKDGAEYVTSRSIPEVIMLQTGSMAANTSKVFNFSRYDTPIKINSIYVASNDETKTEIDFTVRIQTTIVFNFNLSANEIPFAFPYLVLFPFNTVTVKPKFSIVDSYTYCEPCHVLDVYQI